MYGYGGALVDFVATLPALDPERVAFLAANQERNLVVVPAATVWPPNGKKECLSCRTSSRTDFVEVRWDSLETEVARIDGLFEMEYGGKKHLHAIITTMESLPGPRPQPGSLPFPLARLATTPRRGKYVIAVGSIIRRAWVLPRFAMGPTSGFDFVSIPPRVVEWGELLAPAIEAALEAEATKQAAVAAAAAESESESEDEAVWEAETTEQAAATAAAAESESEDEAVWEE